jgi:hypothetical protein
MKIKVRLLWDLRSQHCHCRPEATNKEHIETRAGHELDLMGFKGSSQGLGHKIKEGLGF